MDASARGSTIVFIAESSAHEHERDAADGGHHPEDDHGR